MATTCVKGIEPRSIKESPVEKAKLRQYAIRAGASFALHSSGGARFGTQHYEAGCRCASTVRASQMFVIATLRSLPSCRARSAEPFDVFSYPSPFWSRDGWHKSHQIGGGLLFKSTGSIVVCNVPAIVIHGSFSARDSYGEKGKAFSPLEQNRPCRAKAALTQQDPSDKDR
jgi:hypothetical protein